MDEFNWTQQTLEILKIHRSRFAPEVLATIEAVLAPDLPYEDDSTWPSADTGQKSSSERRSVTVLFAEISDNSPDPEHAWPPRAKRDIWRRIDQTIVAHGGTIDKHMGDVVMAVFGVPKAAENDAERAVRCGLSIVQLALAQLGDETQATHQLPGGLLIRAGINTGLVSVGTVGSDGETTVIGDVVNVASRLRELAESGSVLVGENTFRLVETLYEAESLGPQTIKGRQTAVESFRVVAPRSRLFFAVGNAAGTRTIPIIGRQLELDYLRSAVAQAAEGTHGRLILVVGEAGVGKSRLAAELNDWLQRDFPHVVVFKGRSDQRLQRTPYSLLRDLFTRHFNILESDAPDMVEARLLSSLQSLRRELVSQASWPKLFRERVRAAARLVGLDLLPARDALLPAAAQPTIEQGTEDILEFFELMAATHEASVIFLEDIHWADRDSLDLLEKLGHIADRANLVIVAMARPPLLDRRPRWRTDSQWQERTMALRPLVPADGQKLAGEILHDLPDVPADLLDMIVRSAGGNPFYMEELVKVLIGDGIIVPDGDVWRLGRELDRLRVPDTLVGVIQARLDRLTAIERLTLQQAAVVGDEFWDGSVQQINQSAREPAEMQDVEQALRLLEEHDMIYRVPLSAFADVQAYRFRHSALREVAYETILLRDRPFYHMAAAEWLEAQSGERVAEHAASIAEHYELAHNREHAATLYELAGKRAEAQQRLDRAAGYYGRALALIRQLPHHVDRRLALLRPLARSWLATGNMAEALTAYLAMEAAAEEAGDLLETARAALALATIYRALEQWEAMLAAAERAAQVAALTGAMGERQQAQIAQVEALQALGRADEAVGTAGQAIA